MGDPPALPDVHTALYRKPSPWLPYAMGALAAFFVVLGAGQVLTAVRSTESRDRATEAAEDAGSLVAELQRFEQSSDRLADEDRARIERLTGCILELLSDHVGDDRDATIQGDPCAGLTIDTSPPIRPEASPATTVSVRRSGASSAPRRSATPTTARPHPVPPATHPPTSTPVASTTTTSPRLLPIPLP